MSIINNLPLTKIKITGAKILYKIVSQFFGKKRRVITRNGIKYEVDLAEGIDLSLFLFGGFQNHVIKNKFVRLTNDSVIFDIGANFGIMSLQLAKLAPAGHVYAFEPTHYALGRLRTNLDLNPELKQKITVINSFVSEASVSDPKITAYSSWKVDGSKKEDAHPTHWGEAKSAEGVPSISLDDFCIARNIPKIDFIKIDTDGHEYEVLKGARNTIKKFRPQIVFEIGQYVMAEKGISFDFYSNYFAEMNYELLDTASGRKTTLENFKSIIPAQGTIDLIAVPK